jgi:hypothetical protein
MIGFQEIGCHIVFDIKMDFTRKARFCAGGHTHTHTQQTHFKGITLHLLARIIAWLPAPVEIE